MAATKRTFSRAARKSKKKTAKKAKKTATRSAAKKGTGARKATKKAAKKAGKKAKKTSRGPSAKKPARRAAGRRKAPTRRTTPSKKRPSAGPRRRPSAAELFERSQHAYHAVRTLHSLVELLVQDDAGLENISGSRKEVCWNALIASFCVHYRAVYDFLYEKNGPDTEVLALDFFPPPEKWTPAGPTGFAKQQRDRAESAVEQLSGMGKLLPTECDWDFARIYNALYPDIEAFRKSAPELEIPWNDSFAPPEPAGVDANPLWDTEIPSDVIGLGPSSPGLSDDNLFEDDDDEVRVPAVHQSPEDD